LSDEYRSVPDYHSWRRKELQQEVFSLREDFADAFQRIVDCPNSLNLQRASRWMAEQFERWQGIGGGLMTICTAQEFEDEFGLLEVRSAIEVPPYAELLLQGAHSVAVRHPEYMLARDLAHVCAFLSLSVCNRLKTQDRLSISGIL
jgi:hypothetical protein